MRALLAAVPLCAVRTALPRLLQGRRDAGGAHRLRQVARDDDERAVAAAFLQGTKFHRDSGSNSGFVSIVTFAGVGCVSPLWKRGRRNAFAGSLRWPLAPLTAFVGAPLCALQLFRECRSRPLAPPPQPLTLFPHPP